MDLSIVIVNWNVRELLQKLLTSLSKNVSGISSEIVVIDNASQDGSVEMLRSQFSHITFIENKENVGFGRACNQGVRVTTGEYILFLNPDTFVIDTSIVDFVSWFRIHPRAGIAGGLVKNSDGSTQRSLRRFPTFLDQIMVLLKLSFFFPKSRVWNHYLATDLDYNCEQQVDQVLGGFLCIKRSVGERVGFFDEQFFLWYEEVDLCKRVHEAGYEIWHVPSISVVHHGGKSFGQQRAVWKQSVMNRSIMHYARKHFLPWEQFFIMLACPIALLLACIVQMIHLKPRAYVP